MKEMLKLQTAQLDEFFVRLKAKHDKPREGRPWVWSLTLAEVVPAEMRAALQTIARWSAQAALATTNSVPVKGKGKGGGGGRGKGTKLEDRLRALENVIVQHERTIHMLEDRCSLVILVRETIHQQKIQEYTNLHRRQGDEIQKKDHAALHAAHKASHTPPGRTAHPLGSQRSLLLTYVWRRQIRKAVPR